MGPIPNTENNILVLLSRSSLDLVRAVEREKLRKAVVKAIKTNGRPWEQLVKFVREHWPGRQTAYYRN